MANALGIDMAAINNHRQNREINQLNIASKKQNIETGKQRNALYSQYSGTPEQRQEVATQMYSVDPAAAAKMESGIRTMKADQRKELEFITTNTAKIAAGLLGTPDAQFDGNYQAKLMQIAQRYPQAVDDAPDMSASIQDKKAWLQQQVNEASSLQEILDRTAPQKAQTAKDANGYLRNVATGERVFEGVEKEPDAPKAETFGQPVSVMGPDGKPMLVRFGKNGNVQPVEGYTPEPKGKSGFKMISDGKGGVIFASGDQAEGLSVQAPTKSTKTGIQKELAGLEETSARVMDIGERYKPTFLTYQGKFGAFLSSLKDKANIDLSDEEKAHLKDYTRFTTAVNRDFNAYRKLITGAAASVQELESLKKATISTDNSPAEFEAKMELYRDELMRTIRIKRKLLREGISVGDEEFGERFDDIYMNGADDDSDARMTELMEGGLDEDAALDKLLDEGYS